MYQRVDLLRVLIRGNPLAMESVISAALSRTSVESNGHVNLRADVVLSFHNVDSTKFWSLQGVWCKIKTNFTAICVLFERFVCSDLWKHQLAHFMKHYIYFAGLTISLESLQRPFPLCSLRLSFYILMIGFLLSINIIFMFKYVLIHNIPSRGTNLLKEGTGAWLKDEKRSSAAFWASRSMYTYLAFQLKFLHLLIECLSSVERFLQKGDSSWTLQMTRQLEYYSVLLCMIVSLVAWSKCLWVGWKMQKFLKWESTLGIIWKVTRQLHR